jgi:hypothetical protein
MSNAETRNRMNPQHRITRLLLALTLGTVLVGSPAWAANTMRTQGNFASVDALDGTGCLNVFLSVSPNGATTAFLIYSVWDVCANVEVAFGVGLIPNAAFRVSNGSISAPKARATLSVTIPPNSAWFFSEGLVGTIDLTFVRTGPYFRSFIGSERLDDAGISIATHGSWHETSANVNGTVLGVAIAEAGSVIGSSKSRYIELIRS